MTADASNRTTTAPTPPAKPQHGQDTVHTKGLPSLKVPSCSFSAVNGTGERTLAEILPLLKTACSLTDAMLYNATGRYDANILKEILIENQSLQYLKLGIQNWTSQSTFFSDLAQGLSHNQSIRCLHLTPGIMTVGCPPVNLSTILQTLVDNPSLLLEELKLDCEFDVAPTLQALTHYLSKPNSPLKSLSLTCYTDSSNDVRGLIRAAKQTTTLRHLELDLRDPSDPSMEALDRNSTLNLIVEALCSSNNHHFTHLTICNNGLEQPLHPTHLNQILDAMESNTNIEHVKLQVWYKTADGRFDRQLQSYCTRNKAIKAAKALQAATGVPPTLVTTLLEEIQQNCSPDTKDCHFVNLYYSLLSSRPHELEKYAAALSSGSKPKVAAEHSQPEFVEPMVGGSWRTRMMMLMMMVVAAAICASLYLGSSSIVPILPRS
jgi:hypothetical protein